MCRNPPFGTLHRLKLVYKLLEALFIDSRTATIQQRKIFSFDMFHTVSFCTFILVENIRKINEVDRWNQLYLNYHLENVEGISREDNGTGSGRPASSFKPQ